MDTPRRSWDTFEEFKDYREPFEKQWHLNLAFLVGRQYIGWTSGRLEDQIRQELRRNVDAPNQPAKVIINHTLRLYRQKLSDFLKLKPTVTVAASTQDQNDVTAAKLAEGVALYLQRKHEMQQLMRRLWMLLMVFGHASLYPCWNRDEGPAGEEELHLLSPFETYWPQSTWPMSPHEVLILQAESVELVRQRYRVTEGVEPESDIISSPVEQNIRQLLGQRTELGKPHDLLRVLKHYALPTPSHPRGRYRVETQRQVLYEGELPEDYWDEDGRAHLPVVKVDFYDMPLTNYPMSFIEPLISPQKEYNMKASRIAEHFKKMSGKWVMDTNCQLVQAPDDNIGQILKYNGLAGALPPTMVAPPGIPQSMFQDLARSKADMEDLAASHDISHSKIPVGVKSGKAIMALQEGDESQMAPIVFGVEEKLAQVFLLLLNIVQRNYQEPRTLDVIGDTKRFRLADFTGAKLVGRKTVTASLGSAYPLSKVAREEMVMARLERGLMTPAEARQVLQITGSTDLPEDIDLMAATQACENMLRGIMPDVHDFDNHALHLKVINEYRKDPDFQERTDPAIVMIFDLVADLHMQALAQEMQAQLAGPAGTLPPQVQAQQAQPTGAGAGAGRPA